MTNAQHNAASSFLADHITFGVVADKPQKDTQDQVYTAREFKKLLPMLAPISQLTAQRKVKFPSESVKQMAIAILRSGGLANPLLVHKTGSNEEGECYEVLPGYEFQLQAAKEAERLNRYFVLIQVHIDANLHGQLEILANVKPIADSVVSDEAVVTRDDAARAAASYLADLQAVKQQKVEPVVTASVVIRDDCAVVLETLDKVRGLRDAAHICEVRSASDLEYFRFNQAISKLRVSYEIDLHLGNPALFDRRQLNGMYKDQNGQLFLSMSRHGDYVPVTSEEIMSDASFVEDSEREARRDAELLARKGIDGVTDEVFERMVKESELRVAEREKDAEADRLAALDTAESSSEPASVPKDAARLEAPTDVALELIAPVADPEPLVLNGDKPKTKVTVDIESYGDMCQVTSTDSNGHTITKLVAIANLGRYVANLYKHAAAGTKPRARKVRGEEQTKIQM